MIVKAWQWPAPGPGDETMTDGTMKYCETVRGRELQERQRRSRRRREADDIDEAIASLRAGAASRHTFVEELFDLLRRREKGWQALLAAFNIFTSHLKQKIASY